MAKKKKKKKKSSGKPQVPLISLLRTRLDALFRKDELWTVADDVRGNALSEVMKGVVSAQALPILLRAYTASDDIKEHWESTLLMWLAEQELKDELLTLLDHEKLHEEGIPVAEHWLETLGVDSSTLEELKNVNYFVSAFEIGNESQGVLEIGFYLDKRKSRARTFNFLLDEHMPWDGAVKDVLISPVGRGEDMLKERMRMWENRIGHNASLLSEADAKDRVLEIIDANKSQGLRLPSDFKEHWEVFLKYIWPLQGSGDEDIPTLNLEEIEKMLTHGKSVEALRHKEQSMMFPMDFD